MTIILWKDREIAADRCATFGNIGKEVQKLVQEKESVLAFNGPSDFGEALLEWAREGYQGARFPVTQLQNDYAVLVRARRIGLHSAVDLYFQTPYPIRQDSIGAVGTGAEFAVGAMRQGATVKEAIELALKWVPALGFGYDLWRLP